MIATLELGPIGTITLPKKMRKKSDLRDRALISLEETPEGTLIRPFVPFPMELYSDERIKEFEIENNESISELLASTTDPRSDQLPLHLFGVLFK
jgi:bifunctional DNA-binding transcriptional regulator/antitoxin component of YhaV-PrlF toxin-antitoxin module